MRRVPPEMFRFTTGETADLNGAVLEAFGVAGEHLETALGLDGVRERLRAVGWVSDLEDEELHETLKRLVKWELLDVVHNHAQNYRTAEEYERRNLHYSLTRRGRPRSPGCDTPWRCWPPQGRCRPRCWRRSPTGSTS